MTSLDEPRTVAWMDQLRRELTGSLFRPGDPGYDPARRAWNLRADHRPAAVVRAAAAADIGIAIRAAVSAGLGVGVMATGHGTGTPCGGDGVLINTSGLRSVEIDATARRATVAAGALWQDVVAAAAPYGLTGLPGSSLRTGVVGYTMGGGFGWLGRRYGLAAHGITAAEIVTASGEQLRTDPAEHPDLFWAIAGGTGNFGVVTRLEFELHRVPEVYAGNLYYSLDRARDVLELMADWSRWVPDELSASVAFRSFPPAPALPEGLRGRSLVALRGCHAGDPQAGAALIDRARARLGPADVDTFAPMSSADLATISMDPVDPLPTRNRSALIGDLTPEAIGAILELAGPQARSPLVMLELRLLGGALSGPPGALSPLAHSDARFSLNAIGLTASPELAAAVGAHLGEVQRVLGHYVTGQNYLNFLDLEEATPQRVATAYGPADRRRLRDVKARYDPGNVFRFNRNLTDPYPERTI